MGQDEGDIDEKFNCAAKGVRLSISISKTAKDWDLVRKFSTEFRSADWQKALDYHIQYIQKSTQIEHLDIHQLQRITYDISQSDFTVLPGIEIVPSRASENIFRFRKDVQKSLIELLYLLHEAIQDPSLLVKDVSQIGVSRTLQLLRKWGAYAHIVHVMANRSDEETQHNSEHVAPAIVNQFTNYGEMKSLKEWAGKLGNTPGRKIVERHILKLCVNKSKYLEPEGASSHEFMMRIQRLRVDAENEKKKIAIDEMEKVWKTLAETFKSLGSDYNAVSPEIGELINQDEWNTVLACYFFVEGDIQKMVKHARRLKKKSDTRDVFGPKEETRLLRPLLSSDWVTDTLPYEMLEKSFIESKSTIYDSNEADLRFILESGYTAGRLKKIEGWYHERVTFRLIIENLEKLKPWWATLDEIRQNKSVKGEIPLFADALIHRYSFNLEEQLRKNSDDVQEVKEIEKELRKLKNERHQIELVAEEDNILELLSKPYTIALLHHVQDFGRDDDLNPDQMKVRINLLNRVNYPSEDRSDLGTDWSEIWKNRIANWKAKVKDWTTNLEELLPRDLYLMLTSVDSSDLDGNMKVITEILEHSPEQIKEHKDLVIDRLLSNSSSEKWPILSTIDSKLRDILFPGDWESKSNAKIMANTAIHILDLEDGNHTLSTRINFALSLGIHRSIVLTQLILDDNVSPDLNEIAENLLESLKEKEWKANKSNPSVIQMSISQSKRKALFEIENLYWNPELRDENFSIALLMTNDLHEGGVEHAGAILSQMLGSTYSYDKHIRIEKVLEKLGLLSHKASIEMYTLHDCVHANESISRCEKCIHPALRTLDDDSSQ